MQGTTKEKQLSAMKLKNRTNRENGTIFHVTIALLENKIYKNTCILYIKDHSSYTTSIFWCFNKMCFL